MLKKNILSEEPKEAEEVDEQEGAPKKKFVQTLGITRTVIRPQEEVDIKIREDRIGRYFKKYLNKFLFCEFSEEYMNKLGVSHIMRGISVPLRKQDLAVFAGGEGLKTTVIAENMAWVMGCNPQFQYNRNYVDFLNKLFNYKIYEGMLKNGRDFAEEGDLDAACIHFRASLCMQPDYLHGMYSYARACRDMYLASSNEEYVGRFKAEALDYFELTSETHPRFAQANYYLGYAYLNMGLYIKAELAWKEFLRFTRNGKDRKEIQQRIAQLEAPIEIEKGYNSVMTGRFQDGIARLEPFLKTNYKTWWPLSYYLGVSYSRLGREQEAIDCFKKVLTINGSHLETMEELAELYGKSGNLEGEQKYRKKIKLIKDSIADEIKDAKREQAKLAKKDDFKLVEKTEVMNEQKQPGIQGGKAPQKSSRPKRLDKSK